MANVKRWLKRARGAIGMGVIWALVWAPVAVLIGTQIIDPANAMDEMWVAVGAIPGFVSGVMFSIVLSVLAKRRRLEDLSVTRVAAWGALAGAATSILPFLLGDTGGRPWAMLAAITVGSITALSAGSAAGSLALAKRVERRERSTGIGALEAGDGELGVAHLELEILGQAGAPTSLSELHRSLVAAALSDRRG